MNDDKPTTPADLEPIYDQLARGEHRMGVIEAQLADNTTVTMEIRDILAAARMGLKVLGGLGAALKWAAGLGAAIAALWATFHNVTPK